MRVLKAVRYVTVLAALASALFLGHAASATAQSPGLDQYTESIPGPGGDDRTDKGNGGDDGDDGGSGGSSSGPTLDSSDIEALRSQGPSGERAANALEATSNTSNSNGDGSNGGGSNGNSNGGSPDGQALDPSEAEGKAPVEAVFGSMFGGDGILLPLIMLAVLIGGLVMLARRKRGLGADSIGD